MATGSIAASLSLNPFAGERAINRAAQQFVLGLPPQRDVGYVTRDVYVPLYLWNGSASDTVLTSITGDEGAVGITWDKVPPVSLVTMQSVRVVITVAADGPLAFTGLLTFVSACATIVLTLIGTRAPQLTGDIGMLLFPHNWEEGFDETLQWKTDVMIAHDRTEQRVRLRSLPRRFFDLRLLVSGRARRKLETWLGMRKTRYFFAPIWRDLDRLKTALAAGATMIPIDETTDNFVDGTQVALWTSWEQVEVRTILGHGADFLAVDPPLSADWPEGAFIAPARYLLSLETRQVNRFLPDVGDYRMRVMAHNDGWSPIVPATPTTYRSLPVCPTSPNWSDQEESLDNKWVSLDNETGLIEFDVQSEEPVRSREASFLLIGRDDINVFLAFLAERAGRLAPFWIPATDRGFELASGASAGESTIVIAPIDYDYALDDCPARLHIELRTINGTVMRRMVTGVATLPNGDESLTLDSSLDVDISAANLARCAWLELVRLDSDEVKLHWVTPECLEITLALVVLP